MAIIHVMQCGACGEPYSWPANSDKVWSAILKGQTRYVAECPLCGIASALRWVTEEAEHPLLPLLTMLGRLTGIPENQPRGPMAVNEANAEIQPDDAPSAETPWSGPRPWLR